MDSMTRTSESSATPVLLLAFELGERTWKLGFSVGAGQRPRVRQIPAGHVGSIVTEIARAKHRFGLPAEGPVCSCYEAGRDGFWLHRYLVAHAITNHVVDSSSIEVNRRARRAKTDRLDLDAAPRLSQLPSCHACASIPPGLSDEHCASLSESRPVSGRRARAFRSAARTAATRQNRRPCSGATVRTLPREQAAAAGTCD